MKKQRFLSCLVLSVSLTIQGQQSEFPVLKGPYLGQRMPEPNSQIFAKDFISTQYGELNAVFTGKGTEFYFSRRGIPGKPSAIMISRKVGNEWTRPEPINISGTYSDIDLFITSGANR